MICHSVLNSNAWTGCVLVCCAVTIRIGASQKIPSSRSPKGCQGGGRLPVLFNNPWFKDCINAFYFK